MKSWRSPLDSTYFTDNTGVPHWLCRNWYPADTELVVTNHGSIDKGVIVKVVHHIDEHA